MSKPMLVRFDHLGRKEAGACVIREPRVRTVSLDELRLMATRLGDEDQKILRQVLPAYDAAIIGLAGDELGARALALLDRARNPTEAVEPEAERLARERADRRSRGRWR